MQCSHDQGKCTSNLQKGAVPFCDLVLLNHLQNFIDLMYLQQILHFIFVCLKNRAKNDVRQIPLSCSK
jgi:hypothetical protein